MDAIREQKCKRKLKGKLDIKNKTKKYYKRRKICEGGQNYTRKSKVPNITKNRLTTGFLGMAVIPSPHTRGHLLHKPSKKHTACDLKNILRKANQGKRDKYQTIHPLKLKSVRSSSSDSSDEYETRVSKKRNVKDLHPLWSLDMVGDIEDPSPLADNAALILTDVDIEPRNFMKPPSSIEKENSGSDANLHTYQESEGRHQLANTLGSFLDEPHIGKDKKATELENINLKDNKKKLKLSRWDYHNFVQGVSKCLKLEKQKIFPNTSFGEDLKKEIRDQYSKRSENVCWRNPAATPTVDHKTNEKGIQALEADMPNNFNSPRVQDMRVNNNIRKNVEEKNRVDANFHDQTDLRQELTFTEQRIATWINAAVENTNMDTTEDTENTKIEVEYRNCTSQFSEINYRNPRNGESLLLVQKEQKENYIFSREIRPNKETTTTFSKLCFASSPTPRKPFFPSFATTFGNKPIDKYPLNGLELLNNRTLDPIQEEVSEYQFPRKEAMECSNRYFDVEEYSKNPLKGLELLNNRTLDPIQEEVSEYQFPRKEAMECSNRYFDVEEYSRLQIPDAFRINNEKEFTHSSTDILSPINISPSPSW